MPRYENTLLHALVLSVLLGSAGAAGATSFTYTALNKSGENLVAPSAISATDQVVGVTINSNNQHTGIFWSGGTLTLVNGTYELNAINDEGIAVGQPSDDNVGYASYDVGTGTVSDIPLQFKQGQKGEITPEGINNAGEVAGVIGKRGKEIGFDGAANEILPPHQKQAFPLGINQAGDVLIRCGYTYYDPFIYHKGKFTQFAVPGATQGTWPVFITDKGIVGGYVGINGVAVGFTMSSGVYATYAPPASTYTTVTGVGPSGQIYGYFSDSEGVSHGFVYASGTYYQIDVPNSTSTSISGVGASGTIFGVYTDSQGSYGFIGKCAKKDVCTQ